MAKWWKGIILTAILGASLAAGGYVIQARPLVDYRLSGPTSWTFSQQVYSQGMFTIDLDFRNRGQTGAPIMLEVQVENARIHTYGGNVTYESIKEFAIGDNATFQPRSIEVLPLPNATNFSIQLSVRVYDDGTISGILASVAPEVRGFPPTVLNYTETAPGAYTLEYPGDG